MTRAAALVAMTLLAAGGWATAQATAGAGRAAGHEATRSAARCAECHAPGDSLGTLISSRGACDAQCVQCHAADTVGHHPTGGAIPPLREPVLQRTSKGRIACRTCHDLSRAATDSVPWRSQSLFDAVFRRQPRYSTYHLAMRNQRGQLCQSCH